MKLVRVFFPRIEYILLAAIFWGIVASGPRILNFDGDLPRHILTGKLILQSGQVSTRDVFSFRTEGFPSYPHEWLSQILFAGIYNALGLDGIVLLTAGIIMLTWGLVYRRAQHRSNSFFAALLVTAIGIAAAQIHVLPRPHIFTYLLAAIWIGLVEDLAESRMRSWWLLPLVMLLWVNLHGMFVLGILILAVYLAGSFLDQPSRAWFTEKHNRPLLLASGFSVLATFLSPSGPAIWGAIASLGSNNYITSRIPEYQSANFHLPETWPFILLLLLCLIGLARAGRASWKDTLLVAGFTGLALYSSRMIPLFAILVAPVTARTLVAWARGEHPENRLWKVEENIDRMNAAAGGLIWVVAILLLAGWLLRSGARLDAEGRGNVFDDRFFPVQAVSWLEAHPQDGRMFNEFDWGGYILLRLWPEHQIFMDGHTHIYGEALTREYEQVITIGDGWTDVLDKYAVEWAIIRRQSPLAGALSEQADWQLLYEDPTSVIYRREAP